MLNKSGISVAPPPRSRLASASIMLPAPTKLSNQTRQCRPDPPATGGTQPNKSKASSSHGAESDSESSGTNKSNESTDTSESDPKGSGTNTDNDDDLVNDEHDECKDHAERKGSPDTSLFIFLTMFLFIYFRYSEIYG